MGQKRFHILKHVPVVQSLRFVQNVQGVQTRILFLSGGNSRGTVFHKFQDYEAFLSLLAGAKERHRIKVFGFCLMANHFHSVLKPPHAHAMNQFPQWLLTAMCAAIERTPGEKYERRSKH